MTDERISTSGPIKPGTPVSVENQDNKSVVLVVEASDGTRVEVDIAPGQAVLITSGESAPRLYVRDGEEAGLRPVK